MLALIGLSLGVAACGRIGFDVDLTDGATCLSGWRRAIEISSGTNVPSGYSLGVAFDHASPVTSGRSLDSGTDVHIARFDGTSWLDLDRVLDPSSAWGRVDTALWFRLPESLPAGTATGEYYLRYGISGPAPSDERNVFQFADLFDRTDAPDLGRGWSVLDASTGGVGIIDLADNALAFVDVSQADNRPIADHTVGPALTGTSVWRIGFAWQRTSIENTYRVHMQIGDSTAMIAAPPTTAFSDTGAGPSLVWVSPDQGAAAHESLATDVGGTLTDLGVVSGRADLEITADAVAGTYDLDVDRVRRATGVAFATTVTRLDQVRFMTWDVGHTAFALRQFDYVIARPALRPEPVVSVGPVTCDLP